MPMIMKTSKSITRTHSNIFFQMVQNMVDSMAMAVGTEYHLLSSTNTKKQYYVAMDSIGYPGLCIVVTCWQGDSTNGSKISLDIYSTNSDGSPNLNDEYKIGDTFGTTQANSANDYPYVAETCVMMCDDNKDTVIFDIHPGSTLYGSDLKYDRSGGISYVVFFARDINNNVLCGMGEGHIVALRTSNSKLEEFGFIDYTAQKDDATIDTLHLTKMVNYLSPGYPEMKSAYVSVVRPLSAIEGKRYLSVLYANGKRWARGGYQESWNENDTAHPGYIAYYPIEPFVNC